MAAKVQYLSEHAYSICKFFADKSKKAPQGGYSMHFRPLYNKIF